MLDEYINKTKNEFKTNEKVISKNNAIIHELNLYDFEERIGRISLMSTLVYMPVFFGLYLLGIPGAIFPGATLFASFGLGYAVNVILEKKAKCKERFKNISKSKNESERLEEILRLQMEIERLNLRNEIIERVKEKHNQEINMVKKFSNNGKYSIQMRKSNYTKEQLIKKINELESSLKIKYDLLDKLSDESVIKNTENLLTDKITPLFKSMMCAFVPMILSIIPVFACIVARPLPAPSMIPLYTTFIPAIGAFVGGLTHFNIKNKNTRKAIKSIKKGNDKNRTSNLYSEINKIKSQITNIICAINTYKNEFENYDLIEEYTRDKNSTKKISSSLEEDLSLNNGPKLTLK